MIQSEFPTFFTSNAVRIWLVQKIYRHCEDWHLAEDAAASAIGILFERWVSGNFDLDRPGKFSCLWKYAIWEVSKLRSYSKNTVHLSCDLPARSAENHDWDGRSKTARKVNKTLRSLRQTCTDKEYRRIVPFLQGETKKAIAVREGVGQQTVNASIDSGLLRFRKKYGIPLSHAGRTCCR